MKANLGSDDVYSIDVKIDDGKASTGKLTATNSAGAGSGCITGTFTAEPPDAEYVLGTSGKSCHLYFQMQ
jgi:hypothetical protein